MKCITTAYKCDLCGEECEPVRRLSLPIGYLGEGRVTVELKVGAHAPYSKTEDICLQCIAKAFAATLGLEVEEAKEKLASYAEVDKTKNGNEKRLVPRRRGGNTQVLRVQYVRR